MDNSVVGVRVQRPAGPVRVLEITIRGVVPKRPGTQCGIAPLRRDLQGKPCGFWTAYSECQGNREGEGLPFVYDQIR